MPPRRRALADVSNTKAGTGKEITALKSQIKEKDEENESLREQIAQLTSALEKTTLESKEQKPAAKPPTSAEFHIADPPAPRRCLTAYNQYMKEVRPMVSKRLDGASPKELLSKIADMWNALGEAARAPYYAAADMDKLRYEKELEEYNRKKAEVETQRKALELHFQQEKVKAAVEFYDMHMSEKQQADTSTKAKQDPNAPKQPRTAYMLFSSDRRQEMNAKGDDKLPFQEQSKIISEEWKKLNASKAKKAQTLLAKYQKRAEEDKERYQLEKTKYDEGRAKEQEEKDKQAREEFERTRDEAMKAYQKKVKEDEETREAKALRAEQTRIAKEEKKKAREEKRAEKDAKALLPKKPRSAYILFTQDKRQQLVDQMPDAAPKDIMKELGKLWREASNKVKQRYEALAVDDKARYEKEMRNQ